MQIHSTFHISLLEPALKDAKLQTDIEVNTKEYKVKKILAYKKHQHKNKYLVK
jgi:hypothetical protein